MVIHRFEGDRWVAMRASTVRTQRGGSMEQRKHAAHVRRLSKRERLVRHALRCIAVMVAFMVAYFLTEWLVAGAATLSIGRFLFLASDDVEF